LSASATNPEELLERVEGDLGQTLPNADDVIDALISIEILRTANGWPPEPVANAIRAARELELDEAARERVAMRLGRALGSAGLATIVKTLEVAYTYERVVRNARIVTEMRPIFGSSVREPPVGSVVMHTLELNYLGSGGRPEQLYFALDDDALEQLSAAAQRARLKADSLAAFLNGVGLPTQRPPGGEG
jgi:hypothetical protein